MLRHLVWLPLFFSLASYAPPNVPIERNKPRVMETGIISGIRVQLLSGNFFRVPADAMIMPVHSDGSPVYQIDWETMYRKIEPKRRGMEDGMASFRDAPMGDSKSMILVGAGNTVEIDHTREPMIRDSVKHALQLAQRKGLKSVVLPPMSIGPEYGETGLTPYEGFGAIRDGIRDFVAAGGKMESISVAGEMPGRGRIALTLAFDDIQNAVDHALQLTMRSGNKEDAAEGWKALERMAHEHPEDPYLQKTLKQLNMKNQRADIKMPLDRVYAALEAARCENAVATFAGN